MQRRGGSGKPVKGQRVARPKAHKAPTAAVSTTELQEQVAALTRELKEAREQQSATSEVLQVISSSSGELAPVFESLLASAKHLCGAEFGAIFLREGDGFRIVALHAASAEYTEARWHAPFIRPAADTGLGRVLETKQVVQIADVRAVPGYVDNPVQAPVVQLAGVRSKLTVPMLKEEDLIGVIEIDRQEVRPFTDKQIELVKNFAAQAVIAVENTRLLNELRQRTDDLSGSLEQQTATSEVLKVISSSSGKLEPVFQTMLANATRICEAAFGSMLLVEGNVFRRVALHNAPPEFIEFHKKTPVIPLDQVHDLNLLLETRRPVHIADAAGTADSPIVKYGGARTLVIVPMLKESGIVGAIGIYRQEVRPFTDKQIELVTNFAAQAVIAIENARLLNELRESLQQQTATADVLKVISRSTFDLQTVLDTLVESAARLCRADRSTIRLVKDNLYHEAAMYGHSQQHKERMFREPLKPGQGSIVGRVAQAGKSVHVIDGQADPDPELANRCRSGNVRTTLGVPLLREGTPIGVLLLQRGIVQPFTDKEIELAETFADQAVIAIENVRLFDEVQARTRDLSESLEQQTATSEVLKVISSSPGELEPVFQTILSNATRLCEAKFGTLYRYDGGAFYPVTFHQVPSSFADFLRQRGSFVPPAGTPLDRLLRTGKVIRTADDSTEETPSPSARIAGAKSHIAVPMFKDDQLTGAIVIYRTEVRPFTDKQIELVTNFAAQAVIAIENTRLLNELRESLQQQTATSEVLKVVSSSGGELQPVFDTMLAKSAELCEASFGAMWLLDGEGYRTAALHGDLPEAYVKQWRSGTLHLPTAAIPMVRAIQSRKTVHVSDMRKEKAYLEGDPLARSAADIAGVRTLVTVPMLKEGEAIGVITIYRKEVRDFSDKQIELVTNFAAQAVIAIENTRLLNELRESLQQQTATTDVLKVISSSPGNLEPVFQALLANATRICGAKFGTLYLHRGDAFYADAFHNAPPAFVEERKNRPLHPAPGTTLGRAASTKKVVQTVDITKGEPYRNRDPFVVGGAELGGYRTVVSVPMLKEGELIGAISIYRQEVLAFSDKQIELVQNFADQAVIAIENVRLLNELRESLQQQTATAEVLKVISSSPGELAPVFDAILGNATRICEANFGTLTQVVDGIPSLMFQLNVPAPLEEYWRRESPRPSPHNAISLVITTGQAVHVKDLQAYQAYIDGDPLAVAGVELGGIRTLLIVPMLKDEKTFGTIGIYRQEVRPFTDKQVELVSNFAAQAAIAIENTRLLNELRQRTDDLSKSLENLRTAQDRLVQTQKLASLGQLTAGIAHEIKNPLNFINNFSGLSTEMIDELREALADLNVTEKRRSEVTELMNTLRGNLDKVVQHGKRADAIVKNMLLHSREGSGEHRLVDINAIVEESLNLAYHGARAEKQGFNITLERSLDPTAGEADVFPQDITRVLLNLISNGFYAATKRKAEVNGGDYEPTLTAATKNLGDRVEIRIRDNGTGIPPEVKDKLFNPFFTTKPAGEGTGLGLSISHDIVVKQHGGSIEVDTQPGEFTEIRIILPRAAVLLSTAP
ncbi:MAG: GAF domain-containing protein [Pseudolabrys sp.]